LVSPIGFTATRVQGAESDRRGQSAQMQGGDLPQCLEDCLGAEVLSESIKPGLAPRKALRHQPLEGVQQPMDGLNAPAHPPQHPRQPDLQAQIRARRLQAPGLLDARDDLFDLG
jgi:hypothetical protein